ncbi:thioredoxin family protein [Clostridium cadaveris]|uniref:thioredoxin family protein n=1 Tax=Clostridium cadaveris TaxID=1529 RepID=UPI0039A3E6A4
MINLEKGLSFEEYMKNKEELRERYSNTELSIGAKESIKELKEGRQVLIFTEGYCKDCTATLPFIKRLEEENSLIKLHVFGIKDQEDNRNFLEEAVGEVRIPSILVFDDEMNPKGVYIEIPKEIKEKIALAPLEKKRIYVDEYREGRYNDLIEKDLLEILI